MNEGTFSRYIPQHVQGSANDWGRTIPALRVRAKNHPVLQYVVGELEYASFADVLDRWYDDNGFVATVTWMMPNEVSGVVGWTISYQRHVEDVTNIGASPPPPMPSGAVTKSGSGSVPSVPGMTQQTSITFSHAELGNPVVGESFLVSVGLQNGLTTVTDTPQVLRLELRAPDTRPFMVDTVAITEGISVVGL